MALSGFQIGSGSSPEASTALKGFTTGQTAPATAGATALKGFSATTPTPAPVKPADTSSVFSKFLTFASGAVDKGLSKVSAAIQPPDLAKNPTPSALQFLPSELARQIPGVAELQDNPELSNFITPKDVAKAVPQGALSTAKGFAAAPIEFGASLFDAARAFVGADPKAKFTVPGLGEISSLQFQAADAVQQGQSPWMASLNAGPAAIFDTLFFADIVSRVAGPRAVKIGEKTGNISDVNASAPSAPAPKTGRLYQEPSAYNKGGAQVAPPEVAEKMAQAYGKNFDPKSPTFFKTTLKGGTYRAEVFQLRPSYLKTAYSKVFGSKGAPVSVPELLGQGKPVDPAALEKIANEAGPKDVTTFEKKSVTEKDISSAINEKVLQPGDLVPAATPQSQIPPAPPSVAHTVAHNVLRMGQGDTSKAKEGEAHLIADTKAALEEHGPAVTSQQLQEKVGVDVATAQRLINEAMAQKSAREAAAIHEKLMQGIVTQEGSPLPGVNPEQATRLSIEEATPLAKRAAGDYYISKIAPAIKEGRMVTINADELKKHFGEDYNDHNHPVYSLAAGQIFQRALAETKSNTVIFLGGGPGSGKSEILVKHLEENGFKGIVYDTNLSSKEGARKFIQMAKDAGKQVGILGILPNLENARGFTLQREEETGRGITNKTFANGHHGFPEVTRGLIEEGHVHEHHVKILDTRAIAGIPAAKAAAAAGKFVQNPLASLQNLGYSKEDIEKAYAKEDYTRKEDGTFARSVVQENGGTGAGQEGDLALAENRTGEAGFVAPGKAAEDIAAGVKKVQETIQQIENVRSLTGDVRAGIYQHEGARKALRVRLTQMLEKVGGVLDAEGWQQLYHYDEDKGEHLSPSEKEVYDKVIAPLKGALREVIKEYREAGGSITPDLFFMSGDEYTPRFAKDKQSALDKLIDAGKEKFNAIKNGGSLSKSLGTVGKSRRFYAATDENGKRTVVFKPNSGGQVLAFDKGKITEMGKYGTEKNAEILKDNIRPLGEKIAQMQREIATLKGIKTSEKKSNVESIINKIQDQALSIDVSFLDTPDVRESDLAKKDAAHLKKLMSDIKLLSRVKDKETTVLRGKRISTLESKIVEASNAMAEIESQFNPDTLNQRVFVDKEGGRHTIGQATTKEIEANTKTEYHKNALANYVVALDRATNALSAMHLLERLKDTAEFGDIIRKDSPDEAPPEGWKSISDDLPQFRGYHMEPRTAEALKDLAGRQKGQFHVPVFDEVNNFLTTAIVLNPIMHVPNVIAGRSLAAAAGDVSAGSLTNLTRAYNEVRNRGPLYLKYLEHGAPFMALKDTTKSFSDAILTQYTDELEKDPEKWNDISKLLGYVNPAALGRGFMHINESITWGSNDIFFMHALMDYNETREGSTMEESIKEVSKRMADYRIPERILLPGQAGRALSIAMQSRIMMFGRFHYTGVIKPWLEAARDGATGTAQQRLAGIRGLAYLLVMGLAVWPILNKMWQGVTGSPTTYESMPGPMKPVEMVNRLSEKGVEGIPQALQSVFTPSPALRAALELGFNVDLFNHDPIYGPLPAEGLTTYGTAIVSPLAAASRMTPGDFALSLFGIWTPKNVIAKTELQAMKYNELPALQTQVKKDMAAGNVDKANESMREFNNRVIATWNLYETQTGGSAMIKTEAEKQSFLKEWGIKAPGAKAMANASALYGDGSLTSKSSLVSNVVTYAKAIGVSPGEAFHLIFSGQRIVRVSNFGLFNPDSMIIVERMPLSASEAVRNARGADKGMVLDHVEPLEAGGTNDEDNLNLIPAKNNAGEQHVFENLLGDAVKQGKITPAKVREYSIRYKISQGETLPPAMMSEFADKYGSEPLTIAEVARAIKSGSVR